MTRSERTATALLIAVSILASPATAGEIAGPTLTAVPETALVDEPVKIAVTVCVADPQCPEPLVAPATDEEMVARTVEILERRNVYGVLGVARTDASVRRVTTGRRRQLRDSVHQQFSISDGVAVEAHGNARSSISYSE